MESNRITLGVKMKNKPLISIIVPVFNAEEYLSQCLDSILNQTYKDLEIICINDGSGDDSIGILKQYKNRDSRIVIIDKQNEGVSATRNIGLKEAKGDYLMFVDADDWLDSDLCESAIRAANYYEADVVMWPYISENGTVSVKKELFNETRFFDKGKVQNEIHRRLVGICGSELAHPELADSLCTVWGKLYVREIIEKSGSSFIDLKKIGTYEDGMFNLEVFNYVNNAVYINSSYYHYRHQNQDSITSKYRENLFNQWQYLFDCMEKYIQENNLPDIYLQALNNRIAVSVLGLSINETCASSSIGCKIRNIRRFLADDRYQRAYISLDYKYFPIHWKIFYWCAKHKLAIGVYFLVEVIQRIRQK